MPQITKRVGAPAGNITVTISQGSFVVPDPPARLDVYNPSAYAELTQHPWLQGVAGSEATVPYKYTQGIQMYESAGQAVGEVLVRTSNGWEAVPASTISSGGGSSAVSGDLEASQAAFLQPFHAALGKRAANVLFIGDSVTEGAYASTRGLRWQDQVINRLRTEFQPFGVKGGEGYVAANYAFPDQGQRWTFAGTGTTTFASTYGPGRREARMNTGATATMQFTGTGLDIWYVKNAPAGGLGQFTYVVDEQPAVTVDAGVASALTDGAIQQVRGLRSGVHTITITASTNQTFLCGAFVYDGDENTGIRGWDSGHFGQRTDALYVPADSKWVAWSNGLFTTTHPDLVVIEMTFNDYKDGIDPAVAVDTNLGNLVDTIRAKMSPDPAILLWIPYKRGVASPPGWTEIVPWTSYVTHLQALALNKNLAIFDAWKRFGDMSTGNQYGICAADNVHLTDLGSDSVANQIVEVIHP